MQEEIFKILFEEHPGAAIKEDIKPEPKLKMKVEGISRKGLVTIKFDKPVYNFDNLDQRSIGVKGRFLSESESSLSDVIVFPWVDVSMIAGEFSDQLRLIFETSARLLDSQTLLIQIKFKEKL